MAGSSSGSSSAARARPRRSRRRSGTSRRWAGSTSRASTTSRATTSPSSCAWTWRAGSRTSTACASTTRSSAAACRGRSSRSSRPCARASRASARRPAMKVRADFVPMRAFRRYAVSLAAAAIAACALPQARSPSLPPVPPVPPVAAVKPYEVASPNGGRTDDYYWLRDDTRQSPEVLAYLEAEDGYWRESMAPVRGLEDRLYDEIVARIKPDDASPPTLDHGYWYYSRYEEGGEYPIYARRKGSMDAPEEILLDGNRLAQGEGYFQVGQLRVSPDNRLLAWTQDDVGRRQYVLHVKDLVAGRVLPDAVGNIDPGIAWANDNRTLLYVEKDPETLLGFRVHRHALGADPAADPVVYEEKDHAFYMIVMRSKTDKYLFIAEQSTLVSEWRYADASDPDLEFKPVLPREANHEYQVENVGDEFIVRTNWKAPNFRIVDVPVATSADKRTWRDVMPASRDRFVERFDVFRDFLAVNQRAGGLLKVHVQSWSGGKGYDVPAAEPTYADLLLPSPEFDTAWLRHAYGSLVTPDTVYDFDMRTRDSRLVKREPVIGYDPEQYASEFVYAPARDGTRVPVSLVYRKGFKRDGTAPLYQYGYGSYGFSTDPTFQLSMVSLLDRGFVFAIAHIRGGQELGRAWYESGKLLSKRNTFTDFVDVTRYLVGQGYAAKDKVFAMGGSAGGLLMGAVANLAPGDYRAIVLHVPFVDVVTTMLDESVQLQTNEFEELGNPKERKYSDYFMSYSPYDNLRPQAYPAMLVTTALWDSQVQYFEPAKYVAKLRALKTDRNPLLFHVNMEAAGHGGRSGRYQHYRETAQEYSFILAQLGLRE